MTILLLRKNKIKKAHAYSTHFVNIDLKVPNLKVPYFQVSFYAKLVGTKVYQAFYPDTKIKNAKGSKAFATAT